jgi:hypothetical protein
MKRTTSLFTASLLFAAITTSVVSVRAQSPQFVKLWQTDSVFKVPESVLYDQKNQVLYVSNIDGTDPWGKDDKGSIGKLGLDGKVIAVEWVKGFQSPKGMAVHNGILYVADLDQLVSVDISKGQIVHRLTVEGASGLNDVSVDKKGIVYVTDSKGKKLFRVENGKAALFLDSLKAPNGVLADNGNLLIVDNGGLYQVGADKSLKLIADGMEGGTDGIEHVKNGDYLVSCWAGVVYYVKADGTKQVMIDTRDIKSNTADIGYQSSKQIVYVPTFWKNSVVAYQLK